MGQAKTGLPVQQFIILSICRFAEPVAFTSIFPYLPEMIRYLGVQDSEVAKMVGWTSGTFSLCQCVTAIPWGSLSDKIGRKPVILCGMLATMIFSLMFGFSTSLPMAIAARACLGLGNGNVGIIRTIVAELVPERELQPRAFSIMPLIWTIGSVFGPAFGGVLANPAKNHPTLFTSPFWKKYPFALPNMAIAVFFVIGITTGVLFFKETLPARKNNHDYGLHLGRALTRCGRHDRKGKKVIRSEGDNSHEPLLGEHDGDVEEANQTRKSSERQPEPEKLTWSKILTPQASVVLTAYAAFAFHSLAFDALFPVFLDYKRDDFFWDNPVMEFPFKFFGGFGMDTQTIGTIYTLNGIVGMLIQFFCFPPMAHRFGVICCFRFSAVLLPAVYTAMPLTALFATTHVGKAVMLTLLFMRCLANIFYFPCCTILLTNAAPSVRVLGTLNGIATSVSGIGRAMGPVLIGMVFSTGSDWGYMILPWWSMSVISVVSCWAVFRVQDQHNFVHGNVGQGIEDEEDEENEEEE